MPQEAPVLRRCATLPEPNEANYAATLDSPDQRQTSILLIRRQSEHRRRQGDKYVTEEGQLNLRFPLTGNRSARNMSILSKINPLASRKSETTTTTSDNDSESSEPPNSQLPGTNSSANDNCNYNSSPPAAETNDSAAPGEHETVIDQRRRRHSEKYATDASQLNLRFPMSLRTRNMSILSRTNPSGGKKSEGSDNESENSEPKQQLQLIGLNSTNEDNSNCVRVTRARVLHSKIPTRASVDCSRLLKKKGENSNEESASSEHSSSSSPPPPHEPRLAPLAKKNIEESDNGSDDESSPPPPPHRLLSMDKGSMRQELCSRTGAHLIDCDHRENELESGGTPQSPPPPPATLPPHIAENNAR